MSKTLDNVKCEFCNGTGIAECLDLSKISTIKDGSYSLNNLISEYGELDNCPNGCLGILNHLNKNP